MPMHKTPKQEAPGYVACLNHVRSRPRVTVIVVGNLATPSRIDAIRMLTHHLAHSILQVSRNEIVNIAIYAL